jgi:predicted metal-binding membrane protein
MLMALLFVFGVMNLAWVALLAIAVLIEKVVPGGQLVAGFAGIAAVAVGVAMVLGLSPVA